MSSRNADSDITIKEKKKAEFHVIMDQTIGEFKYVTHVWSFLNDQDRTIFRDEHIERKKLSKKKQSEQKYSFKVDDRVVSKINPRKLRLLHRRMNNDKYLWYNDRINLKIPFNFNTACPITPIRRKNSKRCKHWSIKLTKGHNILFVGKIEFYIIGALLHSIVMIEDIPIYHFNSDLINKILQYIQEKLIHCKKYEGVGVVMIFAFKTSRDV